MPGANQVSAWAWGTPLDFSPVSMYNICMIKPTGIGIRRRVELFNENYYIVVTPTSVECTVPAENRPENRKTRLLVDELCREISVTMEMLAK